MSEIPVPADVIRNPTRPGHTEVSGESEFRTPPSVALLDHACCLLLQHLIHHLSDHPNDDKSRRPIEANVKLVKAISAPIAVSLRAARYAAAPQPRRWAQPGWENDDDDSNAADADPDKPTGKMGEINQEVLDRLHRKYPHVPREHKALLRAAAMDIYGPDFMTDIDVNKAYGRPSSSPSTLASRHHPTQAPHQSERDARASASTASKCDAPASAARASCTEKEQDEDDDWEED